MEDHNSPEAVTARADQPDPIVMYLIVRESLNMGAGKMAAQVGHATQILLMQYFKMLRNEVEGIAFTMPLTPNDRLRMEFIMKEWLDSSFRKVVLRADDKEFAKVKEALPGIVVVDAGITEVPAGSETVIGLWPMKRSLAPKLIKRLQAVK